MQACVSVKAGIAFVDCQHLCGSVFHEQLQRVVNCGFRESRNLFAQGHIDFVNARMRFMLEQIVHNCNALYGWLDVVIKQVFVNVHFFFQLCNCCNSNSMANIERFFLMAKPLSFFLIFLLLAQAEVRTVCVRMVLRRRIRDRAAVF